MRYELTELANLPILQGEENDYGDYDYLANDIPQNSITWSSYGYKCESCGKYHKFNKVYDYVFPTLDGWDSMTSIYCWKCEIDGQLFKFKTNIKKTVKLQKEALLEAIKMKKVVGKKQSFFSCYKLMKKIYKK